MIMFNLTLLLLLAVVLLTPMIALLVYGASILVPALMLP